MERKGIRTKNIEKIKSNLFVALLSVVIVICSRISIPTVIPFTLQSFGVFLAFYLLGGKRGLFCVLLYLAMGLIGLPISASGLSGFALLFGVTGGYLIGWILCGIIVCIFERCFGDNRKIKLISLTVGTLVCYAVGTAWFVVVCSQNNEAVGLWSALCTCVFPFVAVDAIKLVVADRIARGIRLNY